jgi:hypothetical protein
MNADAAPGTQDAGIFRRGLVLFESASGQSLRVWATMAGFNIVMQVLFFGEMRGEKSQGEFGTLIAALGVVGLLTVPVLGLSQAFRLYLQNVKEDSRVIALRGSSLAVTETFAWLWCAVCLVLIFLPYPLPNLPRYSLQLFALMCVLLALSGCVSAAICEAAGRTRYWTTLAVGALVVRLVFGGLLVAYQPWAEAGLAALLVAGFVTLAPVLQPRDLHLAARLKTCREALDRDFLVFAGATLSVLVGIYLFTNADRIASVRWMNVQFLHNVLSAEGTQAEFDTYQATGLLSRCLLWGIQPLLWMFYAERSKLNKTPVASLKFIWIYLALLFIGTLVFGFGSSIVGQRWSVPAASNYGPTFAVILLPLGLLQGLGIFSLASRRYHECFVLGGCSIVYLLILTFFGRRPDLMLPFMFGSSVVCLMIVLFVGVVRWGRKQP